MFGLKIGGARKQQYEPQGETVTARLNAKLQPIDRGEFFETPLSETLEHANLGVVRGGGAQLCEHPYGIEYSDLEINLDEVTEEALALIIKRLNDLGAPRGSHLIIHANGKKIPFGVMEGIAVYLNGVDLDDEVYRTCDVNFVIDEFDRLLEGKGSFRGYWEGERETALFCYGASYMQMKAALAPFLADYPLCEGARVEQIA